MVFRIGPNHLINGGFDKLDEKLKEYRGGSVGQRGVFYSNKIRKVVCYDAFIPIIELSKVIHLWYILGKQKYLGGG